MDVRARAKINLYLRVLDRRPDGYHTIETVYQSVDLADRLFVEAADRGISLECRGAEVPAGADNLVVRAAETMRREFPERISGLRIVLEKHIPIGGGLGGGSADAAAILRACNEIFRLNLCSGELHRLGAEIGMDVPFLVEGGRAIGRERGEVIEPIKMTDIVCAVIAVPPVAISTRWAYEQLDALGPSDLPPVEEFVAHLAENPLVRWAGLCRNDFEKVVFPAYPEIQNLRNRLMEAGCAGAFLSGSGAAVVGLTADPEHAAGVARKVRGLCKLSTAVPFHIGSVKA